MNELTASYVELYKRGRWNLIPVHTEGRKIYFLSKAQLKALEYLFDKKTFYVGYGGSGMSGKTQLECFWVLFNSLAYPDTRWMIGRSEMKNLKLTTYQTLFKTLKFYNLYLNVDYHYNEKAIFTFFNESKIIGKDTKYYPSDPEMTDLGGLELTGAVLDESVENKEKVIHILTSRVNRWNNKKYDLPAKILEGFNPMKNHVYTRYWKPFKNNAETEDTKFVRALCTDNPHPDAKAWAENILKTGDRITIQRLLKGNFDYDIDDNSLVNFEKIVDIFTNTFVELDENGEKKKSYKFMSCDVAISNNSFVVINWDGLVIEEMKVIKNISPTKIDTKMDGMVENKINFNPLLKVLKDQAEKYQVPRSNIVYDADGIGRHLIKLFPGAVPIHNNSASIGGEYKNLKCQLEFMLAEYINDAKIYCKADLTPDIKSRMTEELQMIKRATEPGEKLATMKKADIKELLGYSPDIMDAIKYRLLFRLTRNK